MIETAPSALVRAIHESPTQFVLVVTGGGSESIATLLATPGGSRTLLEALVPYSAAAIDDFLGGPPDGYCTQAAARAMAIAAFRRARHLAGEPSPDKTLAGIACTASLASDRPKRGPHRAHVAVQTADYTLAASLELVKGHRTRVEEERLVAQLILNHVALACGLPDPDNLPLAEGERVVSQRVDARPDWRDLLTCQLDAACLGGDNEPAEESPADEPLEAPPSSGLIFPGSFHPRHAGHRGMADVAARRLGATVEYEISIENVDKPPLDYFEIAERVVQFTPDEPLWLTRAATFLEKACLFPGATFIVGTDTLVRIAEPRYYGDDPGERDEAVCYLADRGCRFLVFGRAEGERFLALENLELPPELDAICEGVPESEFRQDLSATEIRLADQNSGQS